MIRNNRFKWALSVAALVITSAAVPVFAVTDLALTGTGDLHPNRMSAQVTVSVQCDAAVNAGETKSGNMTVHIFQPSGRLLNIGIGSAPAPITCDGIPQEVLVDVAAIPGLKFKPGPATAIVKLTEQTTDSTAAIVDSTTTEVGGKVNLRP